MKLALLALLLSACTINHAYVIDGPPTSDPVPAVRVKGGTPVLLHASTIDLSTQQPQPDGKLRVVARSRSKMLDAGIAMTLIGSALSIAGGAVFFAGLESRDARFTAGLIMNPIAEPLMITGTVLWILALRKHPQESSQRLLGFSR